MSQIHHVIYVPGLGDNKARGQDNAVKNWSKHGLVGHYMPIGWADGEAFDAKLDRLIKKVDELSKQGHMVSLVGASAGASAVLNTYAKRPNIHAVICISGKINNPDSIGQRIFSSNPAFKDSVYVVAKSLASLEPNKISRIMSIHPIYDSYVPVADTIIKGAVEKRVLIIGHAFGIFYTLAFRSKIIADFIKSLPAS